MSKEKKPDDADVVYFVFRFDQKKWKRYSKEERAYLDRKDSRTNDRFYSAVFPPFDPLSSKRHCHPQDLTRRERREIIIRYLAMAGMRLLLEQQKEGSF